MRQLKYMEVIDNVIYRKVTYPKLGDLTQLLCLKELVLESLHDHNGHQGIERTFNLVRQRCYWPKMYVDVKNYCKKCDRCSVSKITTPTAHTDMGHLSASEPLGIIAVDFTVLESALGYKNVLVITDVFTK